MRGLYHLGDLRFYLKNSRRLLILHGEVISFDWYFKR